MLPHPDTVRRITELHDQERLRAVAHQQLAVGANTRAHPRPVRAWSTWPAALSRLTRGIRRAWRDAGAAVRQVAKKGWDASFCRDFRLYT